MNKNFKRIIAYIIDTMLVTLVAVLLTNTKQINFQLDNYNKIYKDYQNTSDKYEDLIDKYSDAKKNYEDKKITKKEYSKVKNEYQEYKKTYENKIKKYNYQLAKNSVITSIIMIALVLAYFGIFQFSMNGQTLGKKLMKLRIVSNKEGKLNVINYIIRSIILNGIFANIILLICLYVCNFNSYYTANYIVTNLESIVEIIILVMVFMNKDSRGLHDYLAGTKVIEINKNDDEVEYISPEKKEVK